MQKANESEHGFMKMNLKFEEKNYLLAFSSGFVPESIEHVKPLVLDILSIK